MSSSELSMRRLDAWRASVRSLEALLRSPIIKDLHPWLFRAIASCRTSVWGDMIAWFDGGCLLLLEKCG